MRFALVILVFELTGSGLKVAGTVAFEIAPVLLLGFLAGALVDRHPRRRVMVMADLARAAVALALAAFGDHLAVVYAAAIGGETRSRVTPHSSRTTLHCRRARRTQAVPLVLTLSTG